MNSKETISNNTTDTAQFIFDPDAGEVVNVTIDSQSIWLSQKQIAHLFSVTTATISRHLSNIYETKELDAESTITKFVIVQLEGGREVERPVDHYNLDAIISVGYRVNSHKATKFRVWATGVLRKYVDDGYVLNEQRLRDDPATLNQLAGKLRELRSSEKNIYESVRECFQLAASDYQPSSKEVRTFYALLQDKFHHAVTEKTAAKLIMDRADHTAESMGVIHCNHTVPTLSEAKTGKNYLTAQEIYRLHLLSEQFLLYAESTAMVHKEMTMSGLIAKLDEILTLNEYPVFGGYKDYIKKDAMAHAEQEHRSYMEIVRLRAIGLKVDLEVYYTGGYSEYMERANDLSMADVTAFIDSEIQTVAPKLTSGSNQPDAA